MAHFCTQSGVRIVAPGVSKAVDPVNGVDECQPPAVAPKSAKEPCERCDAIAAELAVTLEKLAAADRLAADLTKQLEELTKPVPVVQAETITAEEATKPAKSGAKGK